MPLIQFARGLWAKFSATENPFGPANGMDENLRMIDDHLGLYTVLPPIAPGTPYPTNPADGDGQIYTNGTYATFNGGTWWMYPARVGIKAGILYGVQSWVNVGSGWEQFVSIDASTAEGISHVLAVKAAALAAVDAAKTQAVNVDIPNAVALVDTAVAATAAGAATVARLGAEAARDAVLLGQSAGVIGYPSKTLMDSDLAHPDKSVAYVTNDATSASNGTYRKSGASDEGSWIKSISDPVNQVVQMGALKRNQGAIYPFVQATRLGVTSLASAVLTDVFLACVVVGATVGKLYKIRAFVNGYTGWAGADPSGWWIEEYNTTDFVNATAEGMAVHVVTRNQVQVPLVRSGVQTVCVRSVVRPGLVFYITIDTAKLPALGSVVSTGSAADAGHSWYIDPSLVAQENLAALDTKITALDTKTTAFDTKTTAFNNPVRLMFTERIKVNRNTNEVTYPGGIAMRNGELYKAFSGATLAATAFGTAYYHYFDFNALLQTPALDPFKVASGGTPVPSPSSDYVFLGTSYSAVYNSHYPFEYLNGPRVHYRLPNEFYNGNLEDGGRGVKKYSDDRPATLDNASIVPTTNPVLNALGCFSAIELNPATALLGFFIEAEYAHRGYDGSTNGFLSLLIESSNGTWDFGGTSGPIVYIVHGTSGSTGGEIITQSLTLSLFDDLGGNVRRYYTPTPLTAPAAGKYIKYIRLGARVTAAATATFKVTGFWASFSAQSFRPSNALTHQDTAWPMWANSGPSGQAKIAKLHYWLDDRVAALEAPAPRALKLLATALLDPLHSVHIRLIGDSITWGSGSTNPEGAGARSHALSDPRANLTCLSWANRLRDYLGKTYTDQAAPIQDAPGSGYYQKTHTLDPTNGDHRFRFIHPVTQKALLNSTILNEIRVGPVFGRIVDFHSGKNYNAWVEFDLVGDNFKVVYSGQATGTNRVVDVYSDGFLLGSWDYSAPVAYQLETAEFTVPFGSHTIQLRNRSIDGGFFRIEGIRVTHKIKVSNDGIIGTSSTEWVPGQPLFNAIQATDEFVFCQIGTNDRIGAVGAVNNPIKVMDNVRKIATQVRNVLGKHLVLLAANVVTQDESAASVYAYTQGDVARVIHDLGQEMGLDVIDQCLATHPAKSEGVSYLSDGLHPNDVGYKIMFENIRRVLEAAR